MASIYLGDDTMFEFANRLLSYNNQTLSVDTTFRLANGFFVTPIVLKNVEIEGDPIFPVAYLIHQRKFEQVHICLILT